MAVSIRSTSTLAYGARTNSTVTAPTGITNGDVLVMVMFVGNASTTPISVTPPSGWTEATNSGVTRNKADPYSITLRVFYRVASAESGNYTFTHAAGDTEGVMYCLSGCDTTTPLSPALVASSGLGTTTTATGLTTANDGSLVIMAEGMWDDTVGMTAVSGTTPTFTLRRQGTQIFVEDGVMTTAGATGDKSHANGNNVAGSPWVALIAAVKAGSGGAPSSSGAGSAAGTSSVTGAGSSSGGGGGANTYYARPSNTGPGATGPAPGTVFTVRAGDWHYNTPNSVIQNMEIQGTLYIEANNVEVKNCKIHTDGHMIWVIKGITGCWVHHCELYGDGAGYSGILGCGKFENNRIHDIENGITVSGWVYTEVRQNFINNFFSPGRPGGHKDGIEVYGEGDLAGGYMTALVEKNTVLMDATDWPSGCAWAANTFGPNKDTIFQNNYLDAMYNAGFPLWYGHSTGASNWMRNTTYKDNYLGKGYDAVGYVWLSYEHNIIEPAVEPLNYYNNVESPNPVGYANAPWIINGVQYPQGTSTGGSAGAANGSAAGTSSVTGAGGARDARAGTAAGSATVTGAGASVGPANGMGTGATEGTSSATGEGAAIIAATGTSDGVAGVTGVSDATGLLEITGTASGSASVLGFSPVSEARARGGGGGGGPASDAAYRAERRREERRRERDRRLEETIRETVDPKPQRAATRRKTQQQAATEPDPLFADVLAALQQPAQQVELPPAAPVMADLAYAGPAFPLDPDEEEALAITLLD